MNSSLIIDHLFLVSDFENHKRDQRKERGECMGYLKRKWQYREFRSGWHNKWIGTVLSQADRWQKQNEQRNKFEVNCSKTDWFWKKVSFAENDIIHESWKKPIKCTILITDGLPTIKAINNNIMPFFSKTQLNNYWEIYRHRCKNWWYQ